MSVKIEWQIFTAETRSDGTWKSNSPTLEELLNTIACPEKIKEHNSLDIEDSMARLAVKGLPYFKITEITSETPGQKISRNLYAKNISSKVIFV
ncbi:hypothetical protein [Methanosarcina sp.]|uniref:hypothetical protein n=1 Tax=Methanosarcina sp. TaxID=2213 RepID=UPI002ABBDE82|nr:hypothetical protein [Methanosarcina sp.]MDY9925955.1 hypothetical protein [Methanosarcina sp.]